VETVSDAIAGGIAEAGLTTQVGVPLACAGVTWHVRSTGLLNPVPTVISDVEGTPGSTDEGLSGVACRKTVVWPKAGAQPIKNMKNSGRATARARRTELNLNMSGLGFK
jgi:hypothetical protein